MAGATSVKSTVCQRLGGLVREPQSGRQVRWQYAPEKSRAVLTAGVILNRFHNVGTASKKKAGLLDSKRRSSKAIPESRLLCDGRSALPFLHLSSALLDRPLCRHQVYSTRSRAVTCAAVTLTDKDEEARTAEGVPTAGEDRVMRQDFTTRWYEVGADGRARMETIANYMQEIGANHVNTLYASNDGLASSPLMKKHRLVWILTKMHTEMDAYPSWGDVVHVESWTEPVGRNGARRDWTFTNSRTGVELGRGTSLWVMMNLDTRRLARIPEDVRNEYATFCPEVPRFALPDMTVINERLPRGNGTPTRIVKDLQARYCDLDLHRHINNVTYTTWFLEAVDRGLWETHDLCALTIEFRQECTGEDLVESSLYAEDASTAENGHSKPAEGELTYLHSLCLQSTRKDLARARSRWRVKTARGNV